MARPRIFVSSTCYDLAMLRGQLRSFIEGLGYEPVMSDYNDVVFDPRGHTHSNCLDELATCDMAVLVIGSRFGGKIIPQALEKVDLDSLITQSRSTRSLEESDKISITQLEIFKAIESSIPVFAFVDERVLNDHATYEKNKAKSIIAEIEFSSIEKPETAKYIFEFINFIRHRSINNSITPFSRHQDIESSLRRQWAGMFQRLLSEGRRKIADSKRIESLTEQFEDLKAAILTAIGTQNEKEVARGVVKFRRLIDFVYSIGMPNYSFMLDESHSWQEYLGHVGIEKIIDAPTDRSRERMMPRASQYMIKEDSTFYIVRFPFHAENMQADWDEFISLPPAARRIIFDTIREMTHSMARSRYVYHVKESVDDYLKREEGSQEADEADI